MTKQMVLDKMTDACMNNEPVIYKSMSVKYDCFFPTDVLY